MIIDLTIIIIIVYSLIMGYRRGIWLNSLHLFSTIVSFIIAHQFYQRISQQLIVFLPFPKTIAYDMAYAFHFNDLQQRFDKVMAFLLIASICKLILYLIITTFDNIVTYRMINQMSRRFGSLISVVMAVVILQLFIYVLALYPIEWIQHSLQHAYIGKLILFHTPFFSSYILNL
ncbi:CvpA family protein [Staphylococcus haemolyticus]|uniref:CvpA family protein n=2 Tax=Staphylococcus haemolyticus TaxID=1283 RepID=UPI0015D875F4|nr:CvpA family protein [Staphylococcus haemolyticus]